MSDVRHHRSIELFGPVGQDALRRTRVAVVGIGGLGTHVVQQLAFLGVGTIAAMDHEDLDETNLNRYVGARHDDPIPGTPKVDIAERTVRGIDEGITVVKIREPLVSERAFSAVKASDWAFGCVDTDGPRFILNELCAAYGIKYVDLATDVEPGPPLKYGGRVFVSDNGDGCLSCLQMLDMKQVNWYLAGEGQREDLANIYGVSRDLLGRSGPSVVSINGVVASLAVTEFMVGCTGLRSPRRHMVYDATDSKVRISLDQPVEGCWYCKVMRGTGVNADVERYLATNAS